MNIRAVRSALLGVSFLVSFGVFSGATTLDAQTGTNAEPTTLEPWQEAQILDKPKIAREAYGRLFGLEDAGNPHLRAGTLLEGVTLQSADPSRNVERRDRALRAFASREIDWSAPVDHEWAREAAPERAPSSEPESGSDLGLVVVLLGGAAFFFWWRRNH